MNTTDFIKECENQILKRKQKKSVLYDSYKSATENERFSISHQITKVDFEINAISNCINELNRK